VPLLNLTFDANWEGSVYVISWHMQIHVTCTSSVNSIIKRLLHINLFHIYIYIYIYICMYIYKIYICIYNIYMYLCTPTYRLCTHPVNESRENNNKKIIFDSHMLQRFIHIISDITFIHATCGENDPFSTRRS